jgi:hypothetical protein
VVESLSYKCEAGSSNPVPPKAGRQRKRERERKLKTIPSYFSPVKLHLVLVQKAIINTLQWSMI